MKLNECAPFANVDKTSKWSDLDETERGVIHDADQNGYMQLSTLFAMIADKTPIYDIMASDTLLQSQSRK